MASIVSKDSIIFRCLLIHFEAMNKLPKEDIITEADKNMVRLDASINEVKRLKALIARKKSIILFYRIVIFLFLVICSGLVLFDILPIVKIKEVKVEIPVVDTVESVVVQSPKLYYTVFLQDDDHYPLAQFQLENDAKEFCSVLNKMQFPDTRIDSARNVIQKGKNIAEGNFIYNIQVGVYSNNHLARFKNGLISMGIEEGANIYKYTIGSFSGYSQCMEFIHSSNLAKYFIVPAKKDRRNKL